MWAARSTYSCSPCRMTGMDGYISKPVNVKDILNILKESKYTITSKPLKGAE